MPQQGNSARDVVSRVWYQLHGERRLLTTFWPQDYRPGATYTLDGQTYRITRYRHAADYRFYEIWGVVIPASAPDRQISVSGETGHPVMR